LRYLAFQKFIDDFDVLVLHASLFHSSKQIPVK